MTETLFFGESVAGLLVDGVDGTPYVGATLRMAPDRGVVVEVPYIGHDETAQFTHVGRWFRERVPPQNMVLRTPSGEVGLFGIRWHASSIKSGVSLGTLRPSETLLGRCEAPLNEELKLREVRSRIDGLREWTRFMGVESEPEIDEHGLTQGLRVHVTSGGEVSWEQGDATMRLVTQWRAGAPEQDEYGGLTIAESVVLTSEFPETRPFFDHIAEHRKVVALLTLLFGRPIHFRQHQASDEKIVSRSIGGNVLSRPRIDVISTHTVRDYEQPVPKRRDLNDALALLSDVGPEGLTRWHAQYERWERFIQPAVGVLGRRGAFIEDVVVSASMSIEAAGGIIGAREGEEPTLNDRRRPTTSTYVYRCLHLLRVKWGNLAPDYIGLARAVADNYNDIKHYDRGEFPDYEVTRVVAAVTQLIIRLLTLHVVNESDELLSKFRPTRAAWKGERLSRDYDISFDADGKPVRPN